MRFLTWHAQYIWLRCSSSPSTDAEFVKKDFSYGVSIYVSTLTRACLTKLCAGVLPSYNKVYSYGFNLKFAILLPVDGCAIKAVKLHIPCLLRSNGWTVLWWSTSPVAAIKGVNINETFVPTYCLIRKNYKIIKIYIVSLIHI